MEINYNKALCIHLALVIFLCGCKPIYEDVSNEPEYAPLFNTCYSLNTEMLIQGVNFSRYGRDINIYNVRPMWARVSGPEIISTDIVIEGTTLEIKSIIRTTNPLFRNQSVEVIVEVTPFAKLAEAPIAIDLKYIKLNNLVTASPCSPAVAPTSADKPGR